MYSNGDYLNEKTLKHLEDSGLDVLHVTLHLPNRKGNELSTKRSALMNFVDRTGLTVTDRITEFGYETEGSTIYVTVAIPSFNKSDNLHGVTSSRGGMIPLQGINSFQRRSICFHPVHSLNIDYNGKCVICCHLRSDSIFHQGAIVGDLNIAGSNLFDVYRNMAPFRKHLLSMGFKKGACAKCNVSESNLTHIGRLPNFNRLFYALPISEKLIKYINKNTLSE